MNQFTENVITDHLSEFSGGMNSGIAEVLLAPNQLAFLGNGTVRGMYVKPRPTRRRLTLDFGGDTALEAAVTQGLWQGACYYKPDAGLETLVASISGRLYQFIPEGDRATVYDRTGTNAQINSVTQCWLWQAEKWVIWNDGYSLPVFFDGATTTRSLGNIATPAVNFTTHNLYPFTIVRPPSGPIYSLIYMDSTALIKLNDVLTVPSYPLPPQYPAVTARCTQILDAFRIIVDWGTLPYGPSYVYPAGVTFSWHRDAIPGTGQLEAGRMGTYGLGRVWMALPDGKRFIAGDIVGGASGTAPFDYRDAVLYMKENAYLAGGGSFTVPGTMGEIRAMLFTANLDASLGQGALQVFTASRVFSCQAPIDRSLWSSANSNQGTKDVILGMSLIANGGLSQNSTIIANGDTVFRSVDGIRSLLLARREFDTWGNVPISREVARIIEDDDVGLLDHSTAVYFDNRLLMSASPAQSNQGVYHKTLVALNFDPLSNMGGKAPAVYDGSWPGLNVLQLVAGEFSSVSRCYAFALNSGLNAIELWELMPSSDPTIGDNGGADQITWWFEQPPVARDPDPKKRQFKRLINGEIFVDTLVGRVDFQVWYRPDDYPCWISWLEWSECASTATANSKPQFRPRMGLGEPSGRVCDPTTNRPLREGYYFQVKVVIRGQCRYKGMKVGVLAIPEPTFAKPACDAICSDATQAV